jgi:hypothetical protein
MITLIKNLENLVEKKSQTVQLRLAWPTNPIDQTGRLLGWLIINLASSELQQPHIVQPDQLSLTYQAGVLILNLPYQLPQLDQFSLLSHLNMQLRLWFP